MNGPVRHDDFDMTHDTFSGHCLCAGIKYKVSGKIRDLCYCHCESCRRAAGAAWVAWGTVDRVNFEITRGALRLVSTSKGVERGFCGNCGTTLTYRNELRDSEIDFTLVSLDEPGVMSPKVHIWVQDKIPWLQINDGLPQYQTVPERGA